MNIRRVGFGLICAALVVAGLSAVVSADHHGGENEGFVSIFNGKDLTGWKGDMRYWSVQDGAITAKTEEGKLLTYNTFLIWVDGQVGDFELRLKYKIVGGNSGVQYRSRVIDDERYVVGGYQADIASTPEYTGILYEERGRGILAERGQKLEIDAQGNKSVVGTFGDAAALQGLINDEDWNDYTIIAKGNELTHIINGHVMSQTIDHQSDKSASRGVLALQAHQGPPMTVQFKDVMMKAMD